MCIPDVQSVGLYLMHQTYFHASEAAKLSQEPRADFEFELANSKIEEAFTAR